MPLYKAHSNVENIFVTNVTSPNHINMVRKPSPNEEVVLSISMENKTNVTVHVEWDRSEQYEGLPTINEVDVIRTAKNGGTYSGYVTFSSLTEIKVIYGKVSAEVEVVSLNKPTITCEFKYDYPGQQTELKEDDRYYIETTSSDPIIITEVQAYGACKAQTQYNSSILIYTVIANKGNVVQNLRGRVRVQNPQGIWSDWAYTSNTVKCNNLHPTIDFEEPLYPFGQEALKDSEEAMVTGYCDDFDTIQYSSPHVSIPDPNYHEDMKTVTRTSGDYNISENYTIQCTRNANASSTTASTIIKIAHVPCTVSIALPNAYMRSGGNDGTSVQTHVAVLTPSQELLEAPTIAALPMASWSGEFTFASPPVWYRDILVHDNNTNGTYSFGTLSAKNLAGKITTTYTGSTNYTIKGFVQRAIALPAFQNEVNMNVEATNYTNISMTWNFKNLPNKRAVGTIAVPDSDSWCLNTLGTNPTIIRILDTPAAQSSSQESTITIEEI